MSSQRVPVLLDTDIGTNVDDALALAYLLGQPRCDLLGVTTVTGEPQSRARLASAICEAVGRPDVPIHAGSAEPLRGEQHQRDVPHATVLERWPHRREFADNTAVDFLRNTIRSRPGEVTLLSIGPMTNLARLFTGSPDIPPLLKSHVLMGGSYASNQVETNIRLDPLAAAVVFAAETPRVYCIGVDVSTRCRLTIAEACELFGQESPGERLLREMLHVFARQRSEVTFNDPLAAASVFAPSLLRFERGRVVEVEPGGGITRFHSVGSPARHCAATAVDVEAFFRHYKKVVG